MEFNDRRPKPKKRSTSGLTRTAAHGHGYSGETAWVAPDGSVAFVADGRPRGAAVLQQSDRGRITLASHPDRRYDESWEAESIAAARAHHGV